MLAWYCVIKKTGFAMLFDYNIIIRHEFEKNVYYSVIL